MSAVFSVEVSETIARKLAQAAQARSLDVSEMLSSAVAWFVEQETGPFTEAEEDEIARETEALGHEDAVVAVRARRLGMPEHQIEEIKAGLADVKAGRTIPQEEVFAKLAAKLGAAEHGIGIEEFIATAAERLVADQAYEVEWTDQHAKDFAEAKAQFARGEGIPHEEVMARAHDRVRR